uniref:Transmembrane protein n=1 Tax=Opuntia streptacantha TaxID=393608 RepID=A0A7C8ZGC4_OPUST
MSLLLNSIQHLQWIRFFSLHNHFMGLTVRYNFLHPVEALEAAADFPSATLAMHVHAHDDLRRWRRRRVVLTLFGFVGFLVFGFGFLGFFLIFLFFGGLFWVFGFLCFLLLCFLLPSFRLLLLLLLSHWGLD